MKWKSHWAIARAISREVGLSPELERALCEGSIEPDQRPDTIVRSGKTGRVYLSRAPHHAPPAGLIMAYMWRARRAYLQGNDYWAIKTLGRALHYLQDKCVHTGFMNRAHDSREAAIATEEPSPSAVRRGIEMSICSPSFVKHCIDKVRPRRNPREAMFEATLYSSAIFAAVLGLTPTSQRFRNDYGRAMRGRKLRIAGGIATLVVVIIFTLLVHEILLLPLGALLSSAIVWLDPNYYKIREEARWHGME